MGQHYTKGLGQQASISIGQNGQSIPLMTQNGQSTPFAQKWSKWSKGSIRQPLAPVHIQLVLSLMPFPHLQPTHPTSPTPASPTLTQPTSPTPTHPQYPIHTLLHLAAPTHSQYLDIQYVSNTHILNTIDRPQFVHFGLESISDLLD